ncbi:hypothetical protein P8452_61659 [Trifolium repens]|nr:hypothetical protein P8452_61659 [Trifolium repens]
MFFAVSHAHGIEVHSKTTVDVDKIGAVGILQISLKLVNADSDEGQSVTSHGGIVGTNALGISGLKKRVRAVVSWGYSKRQTIK